jgi:rhodanese-related sulfurtransferase
LIPAQVDRHATKSSWSFAAELIALASSESTQKRKTMGSYSLRGLRDRSHQEKRDRPSGSRKAALGAMERQSVLQTAGSYRKPLDAGPPANTLAIIKRVDPLGIAQQGWRPTLRPPSPLRRNTGSFLSPLHWAAGALQLRCLDVGRSGEWATPDGSLGAFSCAAHEKCMPKEISVQDLAGMQNSREPVFLLDVRQPWEHQFVALPGSMLIPLPELARRSGEVQPSKGSLVVVYCHHGIRSMSGAALLEQLGFENVASLVGGIDAWAMEVDPTMPRY